MIKNTLVLMTLILSMTLSYGQITGNWKTFDEDTGDAKSIIYIYEATNGTFYGKIKELLREEAKGKMCTECTGSNKDKPIKGLIMILGMEKVGDEYKNGKILDPENGKVYSCKMWLDSNGDLQVRGYVGIFYRTQTWKKLTK